MAIETTTQHETTVDLDAPEEVAPHQSLVRRLLRDRLAVVGLLIVVLFSLGALFAPALAPHEPGAVDVTERLEGSSLSHPLGTDELGRDTLSRLLFGARWSLGVAALATVITIAIGIAVGTAAGYLGGRLDSVLMRVVDVLLAFPTLVLYLAIVGTLGPGLRNVMIALVSITWVEYARVVRGLVLQIREHDFVRASRALGARDHRLVFRHILPNVVPPVVILASLQTGTLILALAALGFFGIGVQPPTPEWGSMINGSRLFLQTSPALMIWPGIAISLTVVGLNLLGDGLRDVLDPRLNRSGGGH